MELSRIANGLKRRASKWLSRPTPQKRWRPATMNRGLWIDQTGALEKNRQSSVSPEIKKGCEDLIADGVTLVRNSVSTALCDEAVAFYKSYAEKLAKLGEGQTLQGGVPYPRLVNLHGASSTFKRLFSQNQALPLIDYAFGSPATVYTSLTFQVGTQQEIHRDVPVFCTSPGERYFGMWVALEDADENNGPLMVVRKGHRTALVDSYQFAEKTLPDVRSHGNLALQEKLWTVYQNSIFEKCKEAGLTVERLTAKKGDTVLWHAMLPHGGSPILTPGRTRYSCVFHVVPEYTPVYQADVFFRRDVKAPISWDNSYETFEGREYLTSPPPQFMR